MFSGWMIIKWMIFFVIVIAFAVSFSTWTSWCEGKLYSLFGRRGGYVGNVIFYCLFHFGVTLFIWSQFTFAFIDVLFFSGVLYLGLFVYSNFRTKMWDNYESYSDVSVGKPALAIDWTPYATSTFVYAFIVIGGPLLYYFS